MSRAKINALTALVLAVFYLLNGYYIFSSNKAIKTDEFQEVFHKMRFEIPYADSYNDIDDFLWELNMQSSYYPSKTAAYKINDDGFMQYAVTGSMIRIYLENESYICYLDEYINDEVLSKLSVINELYYIIEEFDYNIADGRVVPVFAKFRDANDKENVVEVSFSSDAAQYKINNDNVYIDYNLIDIEKSSFRHKNFENIDERLNSYDVNNYTDEQSSISGPEYYLSNDIVEINGEQYLIISCGECTPFMETITYQNFRYDLQSFTFVFAAAALFVYAAVNLLYNKNKRMNDAKQAFVSAAAHELKTPLAAIQNNSECIIENVAPEKNEKYINNIHNESLRMSRLVASLLQYNRLAAATSVEKTDCVLSDIVKNECKEYSLSAQDKGARLELDIKTDIKIKANADLMALVIDNFLSNAVKNTKQGGRIIVTVKKYRRGCMTSVFNEGQGIPAEYLDNLWDVFYRTDKVRNSADDSTGMGLAICKQILELHGFKYGFYNKTDGVEFYFYT